MKINLPVFKDEEAKDVVTYQSCRWDLMVYQCAGCRDHTLLPFANRSLQGYSRELVQTSGRNITLDDVLRVLDEHYNNVKVLDTLKKELFQLQMVDKETISEWASAFWGISRYWQFPSLITFPQIMWQSWRETASLADFPIESNGGLPEVGSAGKNLLRLPKGCPWDWEGSFHRVAPRPQSPNYQ